MRGLVHLGAVASLLYAFADAPLQHAHASDPHHGHARAGSHAHWNGDAEAGNAWKALDHDSDARLLDWFAGSGIAPQKILPAKTVSLSEVVPEIRAARICELTPHNHDPPALRSATSRGPPA